MNETNSSTKPEISVKPAAVATVKTHSAAAISDSIFWTAHLTGVVLIVIALAWIFIAKGPTRKDAVKALLEENSKKEKH